MEVLGRVERRLTTQGFPWVRHRHLPNLSTKKLMLLLRRPLKERTHPLSQLVVRSARGIFRGVYVAAASRV